jgi:hypothetical protein
MHILEATPPPRTKTKKIKEEIEAVGTVIESQNMENI